MQKRAIIGIIAAVIFTGVIVYLLFFSVPSEISKECSGDPDYRECVRMEKEGRECFFTEDPQACLAEKGIPIDEPVYD